MFGVVVVQCMCEGVVYVVWTCRVWYSVLIYIGVSVLF